MFDGRHHFASTATLIGKDNRKVTVAVGVNVPDDWSVSLSTHIDITEQLRDREAILSAREDLARASRALAVGAISTTLSHELNQPLLAIGLGTKSAERWLERTPPRLEEVARSLEGIRLNADRMSAIIRNTRDKLVKGAKELSRVDLRQLLTETSYVLEGDLAARRSRMQLSLDDDAIEVMADRTDIQQVFINLITNAADAMAQVECERIVTIASHRSTEQRLTIEVSDNGPGISDENLKLVFQPFFSTKSGGMGMGLQICRSIIESFGGTLNVRNNQGRGATFIISLPLPPASDTGQAP
nr:ATP-binding protein [Rhizobium wenxiniae]